MTLEVNMSAIESPSRQVAEYERQMRDFFEPQLRLIGLDESTISGENIEQLEASLRKVDDAIANADSFGKRKVAAATGGVKWHVLTLGSEDVAEIGILPLLLQRKGQILDRISALRPEQQLREFRDDIATTVSDPQARTQLIDIIDRRFEEQRSIRESLDREQAELESKRAEARIREMRLQIQIRERRAAIYRSFLERESVASVVGAILLVVLGVTLIIGMFVHVTASDVISNAFLLILGYFFGTSVIRERRSRERE
jgi:hypothetical protein